MCTAKHFKYLSLFIVHLTAGGNYRFFKKFLVWSHFSVLSATRGIFKLIGLIFSGYFNMAPKTFWTVYG